MSRIDLVIFGATGFTGKHAVEKMVSFAKKYSVPTWAVAGRSEKKLQALMLEISKKTGEDLSDVKRIIADVEDEKSLKDMCSQAKVVVNCCGPYRLYGEPVVRAAIDSKAHYVDVAGEPQFVELMQLLYNAQAQEAGVFIISCCGFDSIPNDLGVEFLTQHFGGTLNSVESYMSMRMDPEVLNEAAKTGSIHYGTWESLIYGFAYSGELKPLRRKLYPESMPTFKPTLQNRSLFHKHANEWCLPFLGADVSVVYRSQRYFYEQNKQRPVQFKVYFGLPSLMNTILVIVFAVIVLAMSKLSLTRNLLLRYPGLFSWGHVTHDGPSPRVMDGQHFTVTLYGQGWREGTDVETTPPNKRVVAKVTGTNPGYGATVVALLASAITVLQERDSMPARGGVLTTAAAFRNTNIIKKLNENNLTFEILETTSV